MALFSYSKLFFLGGHISKKVLHHAPPMTTHDLLIKKLKGRGAATIRELQLLSPQLLRLWTKEKKEGVKRGDGVGWVDRPPLVGEVMLELYVQWM